MAKQKGWTYTGSANFEPVKGAGSSSDRTNLENRCYRMGSYHNL